VSRIIRIRLTGTPEGGNPATLGHRGSAAVTDAPTEREEEGAWARLRRRKVVQ
jgi:hypothetical protein